MASAYFSSSRRLSSLRRSQRVATLSAYVLASCSSCPHRWRRRTAKTAVADPHPPGIVAVVTFIAPFVLGFTGVTGSPGARGCWLVATAVVGASLRLGHRPSDGRLGERDP